MPDPLLSAYAVASQSPVLSALLGLALVLFVAFFFTPWVLLRAKLSGLSRQISSLKQSGQLDPRKVAITDKRLGHLWQQFFETLHLPMAEVNQRTGIAKSGNYRATIPAEAIFNSQSVYEGRIHTEFFKHLPGLLTGLGIIGTFAGLIHGLGSATGPNGQLNTELLITSVREAFYVSAAAITFAMIITFIEKLCVASLHRALEQLCQQVDALYSSGAGEEYLSRLVHSSEESAAQARILKDALVGELSAILERLTQQQIEAAAKQQANLQQTLVSAIDRGLSAPLGELAQGFNQFRAQQGQELTQSLQDSMAAFADKLDQVLGGQVGQAKDLQQQTLHALEQAVSAFQSMAQEVGRAGTNATSAMSSQLDKAIADMAAGQGQMTSTMRSFVDELRAAVVTAQADTSGGVEKLLTDLGRQLDGALRSVQQQTNATSVAHQEHLGSISASTHTALSELAGLVRSQTAAIDQAALAMRGAVADLGTSVDQSVTRMGEGAHQMRQAADLFTTSGRAISDVFDRSKSVSLELSQTARTLSASTQDVQAVISDYRAARETFAGIVDGLKGTVETAKREVALTSDLVSRLETAGQRLIAAQGHADDYLAKLNGVLAEAHGSFSSQMLQTVRSTNGEFHESLRKATGLLASTIAEFENALGDNTPRSPPPRRVA